MGFVNMTDIYPIRFSKAQLDSAPEKERLFYLMICQLANDLNCLSKLIIIAANPIKGHEIKNIASTMMCWFLVKLLAGKLNEGWELIKSDFFPLYKKYENEFSDEEKKKLKELKKYFGKKNIIYEMRNKFSFHADQKMIRHGYQILPEGDYVDFLSVYAGHCIYLTSETITTLAMTKMVESEDWKEAVNKITGEIMQVTGWMGDFILDFIKIFAIKYIAQKIDVKDKITFEDSPDILSIEIPFFSNPPNKFA